MAKILEYTGEGLLDKPKGVDLDIYLPSDDLIDAVNLALQLKRPLLLMGEPGCGKTRLAEAVAYEFHKAKMDNHYFRWDIKSTTKAKEGIYQYDALKRLHHANLKNSDNHNVEKISDYITYGALANAFTKAQNGDFPNILLIDEVDKANIDFPNDLLLELENKAFEIPELNKKIKAESEILIIITSNQEKELPPAFLRRCIYYFIEFPSEDTLKKIVSKHIQSVDDEKVDKAFELFFELREELTEAEKKPSTSELIDWFKMIDFYNDLKTGDKALSKVEKRLVAQLDYLDNGKIPFKQLLVKTRAAQQKISDEE
jgi:MoxR-like ATPase